MSLLSQINKCFCSFTVPPTVEFGPEYFDGLVIKSGDSLRIKALVQGRPVPRVTWFKDGVEIERRMNMEITDVLGSTSLFVRDATRDHRGVYTVEAKNVSGSTKAEVTVKVQGIYNKFSIIY
jgi:titin